MIIRLREYDKKGFRMFTIFDTEGMDLYVFLVQLKAHLTSNLVTWSDSEDKCRVSKIDFDYFDQIAEEYGMRVDELICEIEDMDFCVSIDNVAQFVVIGCSRPTYNDGKRSLFSEVYHE